MLANLPTNRFAQIKYALVLDIRGFERICPDAPLLHQFALNERRDERRHPALPYLYINRYICGIAYHYIPEVGIEQKILRVFQIRLHLNQDVGVVDKMLICSHGSLS